MAGGKYGCFSHLLYPLLDLEVSYQNPGKYQHFLQIQNQTFVWTSKEEGNTLSTTDTGTSAISTTTAGKCSVMAARSLLFNN